jgi:lipopolysaccharide/colanic/teichoic acid biosynthesis glycosyltransferase
MNARQRPDETRARASNDQNERVGLHVIDEELFRGVLIRERRRSDRSNRAFILLLLDVNDERGAVSPSMWEATFGALGAVTREIDVLGWFEWPAAIGLILPEIRASDLANACDRLEARVRREIGQRLDAEAVDRISIALHVHAEPGAAGKHGRGRVDSLLSRGLHSCPEQGWIYDVTKRVLDVLASLTLLVVLSPLLLAAGMLVKLTSRGPIFFRQVRIGQMMKPFTILKFRTMHSNADHGLHREFVSRFITASGHGHEAGTNGVFKLTGDPRITTIGRLLRKMSVDELPQLWNVLRGDMSLVGPRPPVPYEFEQYKPWHRRRVLEVKPGITGLWQVAGRSRTTFDEMVRLDLRYVRTRSLWTDIKILVATPAAVISGKGAC